MDNNAKLANFILDQTETLRNAGYAIPNASDRDDFRNWMVDQIINKKPEITGMIRMAVKSGISFQ
jgi:hypothetical protein